MNKFTMQTAAWSVAVLISAPVCANITGFVRDADTSGPIAGAVVHLQAQPQPSTTSAADGSFTLLVNPGLTVTVTASLTYNPAATTNYVIKGVSADNGDIVIIRLDPIPATENTSYQPIKAVPMGGCGDCHAEQLGHWQQSNHAFSAQNPWVLDVFSGTGTAGGGNGYVFTDLHDPGDTGYCAVCHAPNEAPSDPASVMLDQVSTDAGLEGVTCSSCHQLHNVNANVNALHLLGNAEYRFPLPDGVGGGFITHEYVWGPLDDVTFLNMRPAYNPVFEDAQFCASCHQYNNPDTGAPGQTTYAEWLASSYAVPGTGFKTCQQCHMPVATVDGTIANPPSGQAPVRPAAQHHAHGFVGVTQQRLTDAVALDMDAQVNGTVVQVATAVRNQGAGHAFPTGISIRNAFLLVTVKINGGLLQQSQGEVIPQWANDAVAGVQTGDFGGLAGRGYAKILQGRINGQGSPVSPVLFIDAETLLANTVIAADQTDFQSFAFLVPGQLQVGDLVEVESIVYYRRALRELAVDKGWDLAPTPGGLPWEMVVQNQVLNIAVDNNLLDAIFQDGMELFSLQ